MGKSNFFWSLLLILICSSTLKAQQDHRFMVFFKDKAYSAFSLDHPQAFLSDKAIERRAKQNLTLSYNDLPVSPAYLDSLKEAGVSYYHQSKWFNGVLLQTDSATLDKLAQTSYVDRIEYIAPGAKLEYPYTTFQSISQKENTGKNVAKEVMDTETIVLNQNRLMGVPAMHDQGFRGEGMLIAVLDGGFSGVDTQGGFAPLFEENRIIATKNFVVNDDRVYQYSDHGTKALSCIGGVIPNKFIGTAPQADFILCVTEDVQGEYRIEEYNWLFAAEFADSAGADIVSTSLGYSTFTDASMDYTYAEMDGKTSIITRAAAVAASKGMVLVTSAGNEGGRSWKYISAPADADSILAVGAMMENGTTRASFSSLGPAADGRIKPDIAAQGYAVSTINSQGKVVAANGTSFSAPLVTGLVAGFWQANPDLSNIQVIERIKMSGNKAMAPNNEVGYGVPDFYRAMNETILGNYTRTPKSFRVFPNPVTKNLSITMKSGPIKEDVEVYLYSSTGKLLWKKLITEYRFSDNISLDFQDVLPGIYVLNVVTSKTSEAVKVVKF